MLNEIYSNILENFFLYTLCNSFSDYEPAPINKVLVKKWLEQFKKEDRKLALNLIRKIKYFSKQDTIKALSQNNKKILNELREKKIPLKNVIYVTLDETASSSHIMLDLLKNAALLEKIGCTFIDSKNVLGLLKKTNELGSGVIIYVDDFAGTGNQFLDSRKSMLENITLSQSFAEYFLLPAICDEALKNISTAGVEIRYEHLHSVEYRPLHKHNNSLTDEEKQRITAYCSTIDSKYGLGYKDIASMVVFYRTSPNTIPVIFRGNNNQTPWQGVFPRRTDLPLQQ